MQLRYPQHEHSILDPEVPKFKVHGIPNTSSYYIHTSKPNTAQTVTSTIDVILMLVLNYTKRTALRTTIFAVFALKVAVIFALTAAPRSSIYSNLYTTHNLTPMFLFWNHNQLEEIVVVAVRTLKSWVLVAFY